MATLDEPLSFKKFKRFCLRFICGRRRGRKQSAEDVAKWLTLLRDTLKGGVPGKNATEVATSIILINSALTAAARQS